MASQDGYLNVDFGFRRGSKENLNNTAIKNGTLNFTKDTKEMFVDIDDQRIQISSVVFNGGTEDEIKAIIDPSNKLYLASDTFKLLYFDPATLRWRTITGDNIDLDRYYTKSQVDDLLNNIKNMINQLQVEHDEDMADINEEVDYVQNNYLQANLDDESVIVDFNDNTSGDIMQEESEEDITGDIE